MGLQVGKHGASYAIQTIDVPGKKRSTPLAEIQKQLLTLCEYCDQHPTLEFLMSPIGAGLSGYTATEMVHVLYNAIEQHGSKPLNLIIPDNVYNCS